MTNRTWQRLNRAKKFLLASAGVGVLVGPLAIGVGQAPVAEAAPQSAAFEVASVKVAVEPVRELMFCIGPCTFGERLCVVGSRVDIRFMSLYNLIVTACRIKPYRLSGPDWMRSAKFDIAAKIPEGVSPEVVSPKVFSKDQVPEMLRRCSPSDSNCQSTATAKSSRSMRWSWPGAD